jgi:hypothetical protein
MVCGPILTDEERRPLFGIPDDPDGPPRQLTFTPTWISWRAAAAPPMSGALLYRNRRQGVILTQRTEVPDSVASP